MKKTVTTSTYMPAKLRRKRSRGSRAVERGGPGDCRVVRRRLMGVPCAATEGHVWACVHVHGTSYHQSPCRNSRSVWPPEAMSVGHAASGRQADLSSLLTPKATVISGPMLRRALSGSWSYCTSGLCSWYVLWPETVLRPMTHAPIDCEEQGGYFYYDINN